MPGLDGWVLTAANDITADSRYVAGCGLNPEGEREPFLVDFEGDFPIDAGGEPTAQPNTFYADTLRSETAVFDGVHQLRRDWWGYSGLGFIDFFAEGRAVWDVQVPVSTQYRVTAKYALKSAAPRPMTLLVDNVAQAEFDFLPTGEWDDWGTEALTITLAAGTHRLALATAGASGPNVDALTLSDVYAAAGTGSSDTRIIQAETDDTYQGGNTIAPSDLQPGYTGSGYASFFEGAFVQWRVALPASGRYAVTFRYALADGARPMALRASYDSPAVTVPFEATGGWAQWRETTVEIDILTAGDNYIELDGEGGRGPNIDALKFERLP